MFCGDNKRLLPWSNQDKVVLSDSDSRGAVQLELDLARVSDINLDESEIVEIFVILLVANGEEEDVGHHPKAPQVAPLVVRQVLLAVLDEGLHYLWGHELGAPHRGQQHRRGL